MEYKEEWKDIPTWEGIYQCSNYGRVKRLKGIKVRYDRLLNPYRHKNGYYTIQLTYNKRSERWFVHRLVATVFQRPLLKTEDAHHKNHLPCCNCNFNI